jgi:hypothetical protein
MLDAVLLGKTRSAVLREMFLNPGRRVSFNELVRRVKTGDGAVARELHGSERFDGDLDLFVIGTAGYSVVTERLYPI